MKNGRVNIQLLEFIASAVYQGQFHYPDAFAPNEEPPSLIR